MTQVFSLSDESLFVRGSRKAPLAVSQHFVLTVLRDCVPKGMRDVQSPVFYLGFILSKRLIKRAVDRNRIKRWFKEICRKVALESPAVVTLRLKQKVFINSPRIAQEIRSEIMSLVSSWLRSECLEP